MEISVIVPVHSGAKYYLDFIQAYKEARAKSSKRIELILVSNNNPNYDELEEIVIEQSFEISHIICKRSGSYAARNKGFDYSKGRVLVFTDIDCELREDYFLELSHMGIDDKTIYSGNVLFRNNTSRVFVRALNYVESLLFLNGEKAANKNVGFTANTVISSSLFGLHRFSEVTSGGDIDFYKRIEDHGNNFEFNKELVVFHPYRDFQELVLKIKRVSKGLIETKRTKSIAVTLLMLLFNPWILRLRVKNNPNFILTFLLIMYFNVIFRIETIRGLLFKQYA